MRKAVAAIRRRNTLSAVPLTIQKPAGQANNQTYRRLQRFFVLTKGMSVVGPRLALPTEVATYDDYQRQRLLVKPGATCYWQTRRNRDSITFDEWIDLDLWRFPVLLVVSSWYVRIVRLIGSVSGFAHIVGDAPNDCWRILTVAIPDYSGVDSREHNIRVVARRLRNG